MFDCGGRNEERIEEMVAQPGGLSLWSGRLFDIPTPNIVEKITKMVEVIGKVENLSRVVLQSLMLLLTRAALGKLSF